MLTRVPVLRPHKHDVCCSAKRAIRLAAAAGLARITFHDLGHSYATGALKAGVSPKVVSERIGHADVGFFLHTYAPDEQDARSQIRSQMA